MSTHFSRRDFLGACTAAACTVSLNIPEVSRSHPGSGYTGTLCLFSKPLPEMDWHRLAQAAKSVGFSGIDLTVRRGGHVQPETATNDLPKAVEAIRAEGLQVPMITTELTKADDPAARTILSTAAKLSIPFFKPGYYRYKMADVRRELKEAASEFRGLVSLGKQYGIQAGYHNHEEYLGAPVWDMASVIDRLDPKWAGFYFDARHAVAEGGVGGWKIATNLVMPRLKMVAVKDFFWEKTPTAWAAKNCPMGEGMVDWRYFTNALAAGRFQGPISLHLEYEVPGENGTAREENILDALERDLGFLKARLRESYGAISNDR
jgi:L-ribulose-5-phosphate 3-epimerase